MSGHKGWVLCVEWEGMGRRLASGGHDNHVRDATQGWYFDTTDHPLGASLGPQNRQTDRRCAEGT
jgi:WD40 repeat protein